MSSSFTSTRQVAESFRKSARTIQLLHLTLPTARWRFNREARLLAAISVKRRHPTVIPTLRLRFFRSLRRRDLLFVLEVLPGRSRGATSAERFFLTPLRAKPAHVQPKICRGLPCELNLFRINNYAKPWGRV